MVYRWNSNYITVSSFVVEIERGWYNGNCKYYTKKLEENRSYEMVGIEYHVHIIYFGSLESLRRTLGYYLMECKADSTPIMKNDPTYMRVITIKDGELDKWKNSLLK